MLTTYNLKMPHAVYGGENAMDNITSILKSNGVKRVAMFTDKGIEEPVFSPFPRKLSKRQAQNIMCWTIFQLSQATWLFRSWWTNSRPAKLT